MKCEDCREKLKEYVEGNLPQDIDNKIEEHLLACAECSKRYEEEKEEYELFKEAFMFNDIDFKDRTESIMNSIDKSKYKKNNKRILNYRKGIGVAAAVLICAILLPTALNFVNGTKKGEGSYAVSESSLMPKSKGLENNMADSMSKNDADTAENAEGSKEGAIAGAAYAKKIMQPDQVILEANTDMIETDDKKFTATLEGRGSNGIEEGVGTIYVYSNDENVFYKFSSNETGSSYSALNISWYDNTHLMIIHGYHYGTLYNGEKIIMLDIETGEQKVIAEADIQSGERFLGIKRIEGSNDLEIKEIIYTDDSLNNYKEETKKVNNYNLWGDIK